VISVLLFFNGLSQHDGYEYQHQQQVNYSSYLKANKDYRPEDEQKDGGNVEHNRMRFHFLAGL
jgi:hypothetical protein